ncbi:MAG: DUF5357 family protein [Cyanobacteriota bacterium]|nr:DUF5357 family protein [Cyanobacteriota bacterium]
MIKWLRQTLVEIYTLLLPPQYFSWQMVLYLSIFSWGMSLLGRLLGASTFTVGLLASGGWIFLALGLGWGIQASRIKPFGLNLAPWVAGGVLCMFVFGTWGGRWLEPALVCWPLVSFGVAAVPHLVSWDLNWKTPSPPVRQQLVLLFLLSLLFSSWLQFYFRLQAWVEAYPSVVADRLDQSNFVYRMPGQEVPLSVGVAHLTQAEALIESQLEGQPWPSVERWLLNRDGQRQALQTQLQNRASPSPEDRLWDLDLEVNNEANGYRLDLWAVWTGPAATEASYYLEKSCQLRPIPPAVSAEPVDQTATALPPTLWASFTCNLETPRRPGHPRTTAHANP